MCEGLLGQDGEILWAKNKRHQRVWKPAQERDEGEWSEAVPYVSRLAVGLIATNHRPRGRFRIPRSFRYVRDRLQSRAGVSTRDIVLPAAQKSVYMIDGSMWSIPVPGNVMTFVRSSSQLGSTYSRECLVDQHCFAMLQDLGFYSLVSFFRNFGSSISFLYS